MRLFVDTNVFIAAVTKDSPRSDAATDLLNNSHDLYTSVLNLMELRTVLSKKKQFERDRVESIEGRVTQGTTVTFPDASDIVAANRLQRETLLYPMDALILAAANENDATLVSFDSELNEHGAEPPQAFID